MATPTTAPRRTAFDRMVAKSEEQVRQGNLPRLLRTLPPQSSGAVVQVWATGSRTTAGEIHIVEVTLPPNEQEPALTCECPAVGHCWHQVHVLRALNGEVPFYRTPERTLGATRQLAEAVLPTLTSNDIFGPPPERKAS